MTVVLVTLTLLSFGKMLGTGLLGPGVLHVTLAGSASLLTCLAAPESLKTQRLNSDP